MSNTLQNMATRVVKGTFNSQRHSSLDELTFNRYEPPHSFRLALSNDAKSHRAFLLVPFSDFDHSNSLERKMQERWTFDPSYSGVFANRLRTPTFRRQPVSMLETSLSTQASLPQVVAKEDWRTACIIKANPNLRGFVTDKITSRPHTAAQLEKWNPVRSREHAVVHDHNGGLVFTMRSQPMFGQVTPLRAITPNAPMFRPAGSIQPVRPPFICIPPSGSSSQLKPPSSPSIFNQPHERGGWA